MEQGGLPVQRFGAESIASDITCGIGDIRAHIYRAQTAQELPKKHHEAGLPEQLPTDAVTPVWTKGGSVHVFCPFKNLSGLELIDLRERRLRKWAHTSQSALLIGS